MLGQLKDLWGYQDRIKQLEACNASLANAFEDAKADNKRLRSKIQGLEFAVDAHSTRELGLEAEIARLKGDRDIDVQLLNESTQCLIDGAQYIEALQADLAAAEELLNEAGADIAAWRDLARRSWAERRAIKSRLNEIAAITQKC